MLVCSNPRVPSGISFLVTKASGISFGNPKSSHKRCSVKEGVLKSLANFPWKQLCWILFLIKLQAFRLLNLLKRDSNTGVLLWICKIFKNTYFDEICERLLLEFQILTHVAKTWCHTSISSSCEVHFSHKDKDHIIYYCGP